MLEVIEYGKDEYTFPCLLVLGCFDAIHTGHRELFKKAKLQAKINGLDLGVMMFRNGKSGKTLYSFEERLEMLEAYKVKFVLAIDYNEEFKATTPQDFLAAIEDKLNVKAYMSGKDFRFGAGAKGKSSTLKNYAEDEENGVWYMPVKDVTLGDEKISTTLIKSCLDEGNAAKAAELLGENFYLKGTVVKGAGRGNEILGYPTVNLEYPEYKYQLKRGVYKIKCVVGETVYEGVANFGDRPTFDDGKVYLEAYLDGFDGDLYDSEVKIEFVDYIRDIYKFADAEQLKAQLAADLATLHGAEPVILYTPTETEQATEEPVEAVETVEEAVEAPAEVVEETIEEATEVEETPVETVEEVVEETPVETVEEVTEEPTEEVAEPETEQATEEVAETENAKSEQVTEETAETEIVEEATEETETTEIETADETAETENEETSDNGGEENLD